ncbi:hypothetical protein [Streptomyces sp. NPDC007346]|uniref:hypothetical protein n=1 Tax=Streptomyces sp. NPDC007346 TaxID=3154682 RepID=UPI003453D962
MGGSTRKSARESEGAPKEPLPAACCRWRATFKGRTGFEGTAFRSAADLTATTFQAVTAFEDAVFHGPAVVGRAYSGST